MNRTWLLVLVLCGAGATVAGNKPKRVELATLPEWVHASMRVEPSPGRAGFAFLRDESILEPLDAGGLRSTVRWVARVLGPKGVEALPACQVLFARGDRVEQVRAWTVATDESVLVPDAKKDVLEGPVMGSTLGYNDLRFETIRPLGVSVGSTVACETVVWRQLDPGAGEYALGAEDAPTGLARFEVKLPPGWHAAASLLRGDTLQIEELPTGIVARAERVPAPPIVEARPPATDLLPRVWVRWWNDAGTRGYRDWNAVGRWFWALAEPKMSEVGEAPQLAEAWRPAEPVRVLDSLASAFRFVARDVRYVSIDVGLGIGAGYTPATPAATCSRRYGDCKDKAFLLRALARAFDLPSYPVLVRTRDEGQFPDDVSYIGPFNHCIAAIALPPGVGDDLWSVIDVDGLGRLLLLDATAGSGSPWALREDVQGAQALVVHPEGGELIRLPVQPPDRSQLRTDLAVTIDDQGAVREASLERSWSGVLATSARAYYEGRAEAQRRQALLEELAGWIPRSQLTAYEIRGLASIEEPLVETSSSRGGEFAERSGDLLLLKSGAVRAGLAYRTLPAPPREWPFDLGLPRTETIRLVVRIPEGWRPEALPPPLRIDEDELQAEASWSAAEGQLIYERRLVLDQGRVAAPRYAAVRAALQAVAGQDRAPVVLVPASLR